MMGLFGQGKNVDTKQQVRDLQRKMRVEMRQLDRQIHAIEREEIKHSSQKQVEEVCAQIKQQRKQIFEKVKKQIKESAKKGDRDVCVVLAKSVVGSRKAVSKLHASKAQINSVVMCMQQQLATMRMAGSLQHSTEVMKNMQQLVKVPEIMATMRELSREMMRIGIIDEMIEETVQSVEPEELEDAAQAEVEKILYEITSGELGKAPTAVADTLLEPESVAAAEGQAVDFEEMRQRLESLKN